MCIRKLVDTKGLKQALEGVKEEINKEIDEIPVESGTGKGSMQPRAIYQRVDDASLPPLTLLGEANTKKYVYDCPVSAPDYFPVGSLLCLNDPDQHVEIIEYSSDSQHAIEYITLSETLSNVALNWARVFAVVKKSVCNASGDYSVAEGLNTTADGYTSHAEGLRTTASEQASHAEGARSTASGYASHAEGLGSSADSHASHAEGDGCRAAGPSSHAEGDGTYAKGECSHAEGSSTTALRDSSHAEGGGYDISTSFTVSGTANATTYTTSSNHGFRKGQVVCYNNAYRKIISIPNSTSFVVDNTLSSTALSNVRIKTCSGITYSGYSHSEGWHTIASGDESHAEGRDTIASGEASHSEGSGTTASEQYSHAEGLHTQARGHSSHAEGDGSETIGRASHAEGEETCAIGPASHTEGSYTSANGYHSHAEGEGSGSRLDFTISGSAGTTIYNTSTDHNLKVSDIVCIDLAARSYRTIINVPSSTSFVVDAPFSSTAISNANIYIILGIAWGDDSHSEGSDTVAFGNFSHSEGLCTEAIGVSSHVEGDGTVATNNAEHAEGQYNKSNTGTRHSVGIGTSSQRKNAFEIMQNGDAYLYGVGGYTGTTIGGSVQTLQKCIGKMEEITWTNLKTLRDSSGLTPGMQYRITDYNCTTIQQDTQSANHPFDIIVVADDNHTLNENARACLHNGDTYFSTAGAKLEAWELKYDLDNDTAKYAWADATNGKGVIYWMKDEWNNECPYDFKNIQFKTKLDNYGLYSTDGTNTYVWTFNLKIGGTDAGYYDETLQPMLQRNDRHVCSNNIVKEYFSNGKQKLNENMFLEYGYYNGEEAYWDFVMSHKNNLLNIDCYKNIFNNGSSDNVLGNECYSNIFYGTPDDGSSVGTRLGADCYNNTFGAGCLHNTFGDYCNHNIFGDYCNYNTFDGLCNYNTFGDYCSYNTFDAECCYNIFDKHCYYNIFGEYCSYNTFGNSCRYIKFGNASSTKSYCTYNIVESGNQYIYINVTNTTSDDSPYRNVKIAQGVNNDTTTYKTITDNNVNQTFQTVYQPANSQVINV